VSILSQRISELTPEKRELLEKVLAQRGIQVNQSVIVPRRRDSNRAPLSLSQQRLWFLNQLEPESRAYGLTVGVRLKGELDKPAFEGAIDEIVRRHEILRTVFRYDGEEVAQIILEYSPFTLPSEDLSAIPADCRWARSIEEMDLESERPFDLEKGPLFRARLLRLGDDEHLLIFAMHHIISDGWSVGILIRELIAGYQAHCDGRDANLPDLPVQYADYAYWQREHLEGEVLEQQLSFWRRQLAHAPTLLELPTDYPRPAVVSHRGSSLPVSVPLDLIDALKAIGQRENATLFMALLAVFQVLLYRYSWQEDICVGSPIAGRNRIEVEGLIGFFVDTLVLRTDLSGTPSFIEVLKRVRKVALGAYAHQETPFEKLVEELRPARDLSYSPLFQVMFMLQNRLQDSAQVAGLSISPVEPENKTSKFDLTLSVTETPTGLQGSLEYRTDLFDRSTIQRMLMHFEKLIESIVSNPSQPITRLSLLTTAERRLLLKEWNQTESPYPRNHCIHQLFERQCDLTPDTVALACEDRTFTYRELECRSNQLANHLRKLGAGPDTVIAICADRTPEMVMAIFGVLKAGGAYVPLDPSYPLERLSYLLNDTQSPVLLTLERFAERLTNPWGLIVCLDSDWDIISEESAERPINETDPENLAYVIYTSGSTGKPKGVMIPHRGLVNYLDWCATAYNVAAGGGAPVHSSVAFDLTVTSLFAPLLSGATVKLLPQEPAVSDLADLLRKKENYSLIKITPAHLEILSTLLVEDDLICEVGAFIIGGEALRAETLAFWQRRMPSVRLINEYGPTETVVGCCVYEVGDKQRSGAVPIGRPIANARLYILDPQMQPVPIGVAGEIYIGGVGLARGYFNDPSLTSSKFIPNAFSDKPGERLYRSGDLGRYRTDGNIEYLGRTDSQVKVRGFRIEPGEIETILMRHSDVRDVAVTVSEDGSGEKRLVAYVVAGNGSTPAHELRSYLQGLLPEYMVPAAIVRLEALPLSPNGKVDRKALPAVDNVAIQTGKPFVAPRTPVEQAIAEMCAELLQVERVGVEDNFFELGGHSLLATRLISRIKKHFEMDLSLRTLFEQPTVAGLAVAVDRAKRVTGPPLTRRERGNTSQMSFAQQRLWILDQLEPGNPFYNISGAGRLLCDLQIESLRWAINELIRRHESLRTTFQMTETGPVQVIAEWRERSIEVEDLSLLHDSFTEVLRQAKLEAEQPFDLVAGPLLRAKVLRLGQTEHVILLIMHHIISDGWSVGVLLRELGILYESHHIGEQSPLPELEIQYADYALWQREYLQGEVLDQQLSYWRDQLTDAPALLELPTDYPRQAVFSHKGSSVSIKLSSDLTKSLKRVSQQNGVTLFMALLGAFGVLLHRYSRQNDLCIGTPVAGRARMELEGLIGFFVNTLVMRLEISADQTFAQVVEQAKERVLDGLAHQEVPFERLVEELRPVRSLSHTPMFQVMFTLQESAEQLMRLNDLTFELLPIEGVTAKCDLSLLLADTSDGVTGVLEYSADLFERSTIERMARHYERILIAVADGLEKRVGDIALLTQAEVQEILIEWNKTVSPIPDKCFQELFEHQVDQSPDTVAACCGRASMTYRELNEKANRLAHQLRGMGIGPESVVGLLAYRNIDFLTAVLAIFKAGGAYLPLDPGQPQARCSQILSQSNPALVLVTESLAASLRKTIEGDWSTEGLPVVELEGALKIEDSSENLEIISCPENLAYVIFTSGSTGRPKGALLHQRGMINHLYAKIRDLDITGRDIVAQTASQCFDISVWQFLSALLVGGCVEIYPEEVARDPNRLISEVERCGVTILETVPALLRVLVSEIHYAEKEQPELPALRWLLLTGEALPVELCRQWLKLYPDIPLVNAYGPTECSDDVTHYFIDRSPSAEARQVSIGRTLQNLRLYIVDKQLEPLPIGVAGELCVAGIGVGRGYLNDPAGTAKVFIPDRFDQSGGRLYRTGDLARFLPDGNIEFLGRLDEQIKLRGYRIELGEIEALLRQNEKVGEAIVVHKKGERDDGRLIAFYSPENGRVPDSDELRTYLGEYLPDYMVPSSFVHLESLPKTPNGKIDRKSLLEIEIDLQPKQDYVAPRPGIETVLAEMCAELLQVERVGVEDNFFELGGHSLLATQLVSRIKKHYQIEMPLRALFEKPTVSGLAAAVERAQKITGPPLTPLTRRRRGDSTVMSFAQQRLWILDQLEPDNPFYNIPGAVRLKGDLEMESLQSAINELVGRHENLRTTFHMTEAGPMQVIAAWQPGAIEVEDLSLLSEPDVEAVHYADVEAQRPFDLAAGPLLRIKVLRLAEQEHVILVTMHHIISDGWSLEVLLREMSVLYESHRRGQPSPLPELEIQYADYALWQREYLQGEVLDQQISYWRDQLADAPALLELPTDYPRPAVFSHKGASVSINLSLDLTEALKKVSQQHGATLFMTLVSAFGVLLHRYSRQTDICIGTPVAGRTRVELEDLIGFLVNTLVMRMKVNADQTFAQVLEQTKERALEGFTNQEVPFERLVEELHPVRSLSHTPVFQVMFTLQDLVEQQLMRLGDLTFEPLTVENVTAKCDLSLLLADTSEGVTGVLEYSTDLFERSTVERMGEQYVRILESIVSNPVCPVADIELLSQNEQQMLLEDWNETIVNIPPVCMHQLIEAQVELTPDAIAVESGIDRISYQQLNHRANQLAHYLQSIGIGPEAVVAVCLERTVDMMVALLGILKAGAAYLPVELSYPGERLAFMVADSGATILMTQANRLAELPETAAEVLCLDQIPDSLARQETGNPNFEVDTGNLAYVIYTSGSTGKPKGVAVPHFGIGNLVDWTRRTFSPEVLRRMLAAASLGFDLSVCECLVPLACGGTVVLAENALQLLSNPPADITLIFTVPSVMTELLRGNAVPASVQAVQLGAERLGDALIDQLYAQTEIQQLVNLYGPTEATVFTTTAAIERSNNGDAPIGRPIPGARMYVLDDRMRPTPLGVPGGLYIGGSGLARGYLQRPDLTADRFVPNPFSHNPGERLYKTGDLVKHRSDGQLQFIGRIDNQVKIRGYRIELGEIESVLNEHAAVAATSVVVHDFSAEDKRLVAYIVWKETDHSSGELRVYLSSRLPQYMIPSVFIEIDKLPLTQSGKVDQRALPIPRIANDELQTIYVGPRTPLEETLVEIYADVLKIEQVGINDNFFELGGHSLLAVQFISRVRKAFSIELPLRRLFEQPTIAGLVELIEEELACGQRSNVPELVSVSREQKLKLSYTQQRLWLLDQLEPGTATYNIAGSVRVRGELDIEVMSEALTMLVGRQESLRTTFAFEEGEPVQIIGEREERAITVIDISEMAESEREAEAKRKAEEEALRPFDLSKGPLFRCSVVRLGEQDQVALFTLHHIISDGWSMGVMVRELMEMYQSIKEGREAELAELPIQYADYAQWQREWLEGEELERQMEYWRERLGEAPAALDLPSDRARRSIQSHRGERVSFALEKELSRRVKELSQLEGATLFMTLTAAFQVLLGRLSGQKDIAIGTPVAGRQRAEIEGLIGCFLNTLVLRTDLEGDPSFREVVSRVKEVALGAYEHQDVPFEKLLEELRPERDLSRAPLFQVFINLMNFAGPPMEMSGLTVESMPATDIGAKFDLTLYIGEDSEQLHMELVYSADLYDRERIEEMGEQLRMLLEQAVAEPDESIGAYTLVTERAKGALPDAREKLSSEWMGSVAELFRREALRRPEATAVTDRSGSSSYGELNRRTDQLANYLRAKGVGRGEVVAIWGDRSAALVWGVMGVLKSGGAFLVLDPVYPGSRLVKYLNQSRPKAWIEIGGAAAVSEEVAEYVKKEIGCKVRLPGLSEAEEVLELKGYEREGLKVEIRAEDLAYVSFTSGSTGEPKGVLGRQGSLTHFVPWLKEEFGLGEQDRFSMLSGLSHDPLHRDVFTALMMGGEVCIPEGEMYGQPGKLIEWMRERGVTVCHLTPALGQLLSEGVSEELRMPELRYAFYVGDMLIRRDVWRLMRVAPEVKCINYYGSTETQRAVGYYVIGEEEEQTAGGIEKGIVPLGRGIRDVQLLVLNEKGGLCGIGERGEIYLRSPQIAGGYLGDEELTKEKFIRNPNSEDEEDRLYKTGDLGRYRVDGVVEPLGRADQQVKIRGYRIELGEIESAIGGHAGVRETAVIARVDKAGERRLVAYLVLEEKTGPSAREWREYLAEKLPAYMIPAAYVELERLPMTPNGKLKREALPDPETREREREYVEARTETEQKLAEICREVLKAERIGVYDSFFEMGGHSLLAMQALARMRTTFQVDIPLRSLFEEPTIARLAEEIEKAKVSDQSSAAPAIVSVSREAHRKKRSALGHQ